MKYYFIKKCFQHHHFIAIMIKAIAAIKIITNTKNAYSPIPSDITMGKARTIIAATAIINMVNFPFILSYPFYPDSCSIKFCPDPYPIHLIIFGYNSGIIWVFTCMSSCYLKFCFCIFLYGCKIF